MRISELFKTKRGVSMTTVVVITIIILLAFIVVYFTLGDQISKWASGAIKGMKGAIRTA